tara:strand:+ start:3233 stop:3667 length:435 start_codon:yes stop_codon:yes gene_type:complete
MRFILAVSKDNKIALGGKLPWRIPHDFRWFKMNTYGETIIMGRKTWDSIGKQPLPGRENIVVSRHRIPKVKTIQILEDICYYPNAWVIGGATLCEQLWEKGDILVLTRVDMVVGETGLGITLPAMKELWSKSFDSYTFSINIVQ